MTYVQLPANFHLRKQINAEIQKLISSFKSNRLINHFKPTNMKKLTYLITIVTLMGIAFACSKSEDSNPTPDPPGSTAGPKFTAVKSVIASSCALSGCHASPSNTGGLNFESNTGIISSGSRIKARAVDLGTMPPTGPLSTADKAKITDWINAGGLLTD